MNSNFIKIMAVIIFSCFLLNSCQTDAEEEREFPVYDEDGIPIGMANLNLVGLFLVSNTYPDNPVNIQGAIKNGKMKFDFSDRKIELSSEYENADGVKIGSLSIQAEDSRSLQFGLHKINSDDLLYNRVDILYSNAEYIPANYEDWDYSFYNGIKIKAGWNFIEILGNPNWLYGSDEPPYIIGLTSQNVNDFLKKGYRWQMEYWF
jgi:hypothetical protein